MCMLTLHVSSQWCLQREETYRMARPLWSMSSHPPTVLSTGALVQSKAIATGRALLLQPWLFSECSAMVCSGRVVTNCFYLLLRMGHCCHLVFFAPHFTQHLWLLRSNYNNSSVTFTLIRFLQVCQVIIRLSTDVLIFSFLVLSYL